MKLFKIIKYINNGVQNEKIQISIKANRNKLLKSIDF